MEFTVEKTSIRDVVIVKPEVFGDHRGFFSEVYRQDKFKELGLPDVFVQLNHSGSAKDIVRGLHFQWEPPMGKLMRVTHGKAFLVAVDIRKGSPTLGKWFGIEASSENRLQVWAPAGCARGSVYSVTMRKYSISVQAYTITRQNQGSAGTILRLGSNGRHKTPILSQKDDKAQTLEEWLQRDESRFFNY